MQARSRVCWAQILIQILAMAWLCLQPIQALPGLSSFYTSQHFHPLGSFTGLCTGILIPSPSLHSPGLSPLLPFPYSPRTFWEAASYHHCFSPTLLPFPHPTLHVTSSDWGQVSACSQLFTLPPPFQDIVLPSPLNSPSPWSSYCLWPSSSYTLDHSTLFRGSYSLTDFFSIPFLDIYVGTSAASLMTLSTFHTYLTSISVTYFHSILTPTYLAPPPVHELLLK